MEYNDKNRGRIQYPGRRKQIVDASGLRYTKNVTPSDGGDLSWDLDGEVFFRVEFKYKGTKAPGGQSVHEKHLFVVFEKAGTPSIYVIAEHETNPEDEIDAANALVTHIMIRDWAYVYYKELEEPYRRLVDVMDEFAGLHEKKNRIPKERRGA